MSRIQNIKGIILRKRTFMESDLIITILCDDGIRLECIAKGAQNPGSRRKNHLDSMNLVEGTLFEGRTHAYLQSVTCISSFNLMKKDLNRIMEMNLILEIIEKTVLERDPHPEIYELLIGSLKSMNKKESHTFLIGITLVKLAHHLGFLPNFKECSACHNQLNEDDALWNAQAGILNCSSCGSEHETHMPLKYRKAMDFFQRAPRSECIKVKLSPTEEATMQAFIPCLFMSHLDKPLKSLEMLS